IGGYAADWERSRIRRLTSANSQTIASALWPAIVAASISVANRMAVATSALHSRQNFSVFPGSSNNFVTRPHTLHCPTTSCSVPFGPPCIVGSPLLLHNRHFKGYGKRPEKILSG